MVNNGSNSNRRESTERHTYKVVIPSLYKYSRFSGTHETTAGTPAEAVSQIAFRIYENEPRRAKKALAHLKRSYNFKDLTKRID